MADVSHRDSAGALAFVNDSITGSGSPEGVVVADIGAVYRRTDGGTNTTLYVKEADDGLNTGWVALGASTGASSAEVARITALEAADVVLTAADAALDTRLDTAESDITALEAVDVTLDSRLDAIEANDWVTTVRITDANVTNAKLANMAAATVKGSVAGGVPADLSAADTLGLLADATATTRGIVPTPPNNTTTFLRGDATFAAPVQRLFLFYGGDTFTAGDQNRFANPVGFSTSPLGVSGYGYHSPVDGNLVKTHYRVTTAHTTNTVTVTPRVNGVEQTTQTQTISASDTAESTTHGTPLAIAAGDFIACQMDHNGATNVRGLSIIFEIEY